MSQVCSFICCFAHFYARFNCLFLYLSCSQDSELSYAYRDGRLLELIDEAWQKDKLPNDGNVPGVFDPCLGIGVPLRV